MNNLIYRFHQDTREYLGADIARESPREPGVFLLPGNALWVEPPVTQANEIAVADGEGWIIQSDYRGQMFYNLDGEKITISEIGIVPDPAWTSEPPPPSLDKLRTDKSVEIDTACRQAIYAGFTSDALGADFHYPAKDKDQSNLVGSVTESLYPNLPPEWATPFWCAADNADGEWAYRLHTAAQIQQVGTDAKAAIVTALTRNAQLQAQIAVADAEALEAISW